MNDPIAALRAVAADMRDWNATSRVQTWADQIDSALRLLGEGKVAEVYQGGDIRWLIDEPWPADGTPLYLAAPAADGMVLPEAIRVVPVIYGDVGEYELRGQANGWNACLAEVKRLNAHRGETK